MIFERLAHALRTDRPAALVTRLDGAQTGPKLLVYADDAAGDVGTPGLNRAVMHEARVLRTPIGLDIGARTPEETAMSIAAQMIAQRERRAGGQLTESLLAVHNARPVADVRA